MDAASNELVFAVVGHAGSGTSFIAQQLENLLKGIAIKDDIFDVVTLKARQVISDWAASNGKSLPPPTARPTLNQVKAFQDYVMKCVNEIRLRLRVR